MRKEEGDESFGKLQLLVDLGVSCISNPKVDEVAVAVDDVWFVIAWACSSPTNKMQNIRTRSLIKETIIINDDEGKNESRQK